MHTPGPWEHTGGRLVDATSRHNGMTFCVATATKFGKTRDDIDEMTANARLIAAAPDLLAVCVDTMLWLKQEGKYEFTQKRLSEAIAKAKGK